MATGASRPSCIRPRGSSPDDIRAAEAATRELLDRINGARRALLSSTIIDGTFTIRLCILHFRSHADRVAQTLDLIIDEAQQIRIRLT